MIHKLKTWPNAYRAIIAGRKTHEYRRNDRAFCVEDLLRLQEYDPRLFYTGREVSVRVTYITAPGDNDCPIGYCVMSIKLMPGSEI